MLYLSLIAGLSLISLFEVNAYGNDYGYEEPSKPDYETPPKYTTTDYIHDTYVPVCDDYAAESECVRRECDCYLPDGYKYNEWKEECTNLLCDYFEDCDNKFQTCINSNSELMNEYNKVCEKYCEVPECNDKRAKKACYIIDCDCAGNRKSDNYKAFINECTNTMCEYNQDCYNSGYDNVFVGCYKNNNNLKTEIDDLCYSYCTPQPTQVCDRDAAEYECRTRGCDNCYFADGYEFETWVTECADNLCYYFEECDNDFAYCIDYNDKVKDSYEEVCEKHCKVPACDLYSVSEACKEIDCGCAGYGSEYDAWIAECESSLCDYNEICYNSGYINDWLQCYDYVDSVKSSIDDICYSHCTPEPTQVCDREAAQYECEIRGCEDCYIDDNDYSIWLSECTDYLCDHFEECNNEFKECLNNDAYLLDEYESICDNYCKVPPCDNYGIEEECKRRGCECAGYEGSDTYDAWYYECTSTLCNYNEECYNSGYNNEWKECIDYVSTVKTYYDNLCYSHCLPEPTDYIETTEYEPTETTVYVEETCDLYVAEDVCSKIGCSCSGNKGSDSYSLWMKACKANLCDNWFYTCGNDFYGCYNTDYDFKQSYDNVCNDNCEEESYGGGYY